MELGDGDSAVCFAADAYSWGGAGGGIVGTIGLFAGLGGMAERLEGVAFDTWVVLDGVADRLAIGAGIDLEICGSSERTLGNTSVTEGGL